MALALNRYLCSAVLPLITKCAPLFAGTEHRAIMVDSMLHTIYRLSRGRSLTKAQRDVIEECLMALCRYLRCFPFPILRHIGHGFVERTYGPLWESVLCATLAYGAPL